jgi:formate-dependent nitrite reductase cytochrome c552 subunit
MVPFIAFGTQAAEEKKATTIAELAAMYDSSSCVDCHTEIHEQWQQSLHARSIFGPEEVGRTAATIKTTIENGLKEWPYSGVKKPEDVGVKHLMICAKCHLPQLKEAEDSVAKEIVKNIYAFTDNGDEKAAETLRSLNIGCTICHGRNAIVHKWTDGEPQKDVVYGSKDGEHDDPAHPAMKESKIMKESILCGQCHGQGPNFELEIPPSAQRCMEPIFSPIFLRAEWKPVRNAIWKRASSVITCRATALRKWPRWRLTSMSRQRPISGVMDRP